MLPAVAGCPYAQLVSNLCQMRADGAISMSVNVADVAGVCVVWGTRSATTYRLLLSDDSHHPG